MRKIKADVFEQLKLPVETRGDVQTLRVYCLQTWPSLHALVCGRRGLVAQFW